MTKSRIVKVHVPEHVFQQLAAEARRANVSMSALIRLALVRAFVSVDFQEPTHVSTIVGSLTTIDPTE